MSADRPSCSRSREQAHLWPIRLKEAAQRRGHRDRLDDRCDKARPFLFRTGVRIHDLSRHYELKHKYVHLGAR